jgi:hypothetical protein
MSIFLSFAHLPKESSQAWGPFKHFVTHLFFYTEGLLPPYRRTAPCQRCATTFHAWRPSLSSTTWICPKPWWQGTHLTLALPFSLPNYHSNIWCYLYTEVLTSLNKSVISI